MKLKFDNITISGGVAVGKNTLRNNLLDYLEPYGWQFYSVGTLNRQTSKDNIEPMATKVGDDKNREYDQRTHDLLANEKNWIVEAWLAGFIARDLPKTLKVLLTCSHTELLIDRVANRDRVTIGEAKRIIHDRTENNFKNWRDLYGDYDFFNPDYFDIVIDTFSSGQIESTGRVLDLLGYDHDKIEISKK